MGVYITKFNFFRIIKRLDPQTIFDHIYPSTISSDLEKLFGIGLEFFNRGELTSIRLILIVLKYPNIILNGESYFKSNYIDAFNYEYVHTPSFHYIYKCSLLHKDYNEIITPDSVVEQGNKKVSEFQNLWKKFQDINQTIIPLYNRYKKRFFKTFHIFIDDVETHKFNNSCNYDKDAESIVCQVKGLLEDFTMWINEPEYKWLRVYCMQITYNGRCAFWGTSEKYSKHIHNANKRKFEFTDQEIAQCLKIIQNEYKNKIRSLIIDYLIALLNPQLEFEEDFLVKLGFKPCNGCFSYSFYSH